MSTRKLNPAPSWRTIALAQLRMVALLQLRDFAVLGAIATALIGLAIWGYTHGQAHFQGTETLTVFPALAIPLVLVGAFWPLGVWRKDAPEQRGYFWSLPADRRLHALLRVGMGWVLLAGVCVAVMALAVAVVIPGIVRFEAFHLNLARWWVPVATATLAYLLVSVLAVLFDAPVRWLAWFTLAVLGARLVAEATEWDALARPIDAVARSLGIALEGPGASGVIGPWARHYLVWFALGAAALAAAAFWHRDER